MAAYSDSESGDSHSSRCSGSDLEPMDWKEDALDNLMYIFQAAGKKWSKSDFRTLTPEIRKVILMALEGVEERVVRYAGHVTQPVNLQRGVEEASFFLEMEKSVKFYFEEKLSTRDVSHNAEVEVPATDFDEEETDLHVRALTKCHPFLMEQLTVKETSLVGQMIQRKLISVASGEALLKKTTDLEKNREVLKVADGLTQHRFTTAFLPALRHGSKHIADKLVSTMEELRETPKSDSGRGCRICPLRGRVDLGCLADPLLEKGLIPRDFHDDLCKGTVSSTKAWKQLFRHVGHTQKLLPILSKQYPGVVQVMKKQDISSLECSCLRPADFLAPFPSSNLSEGPSDIACMSDVASMFYPRKAAVPEYPMTSGKRGICWVVENSVYTDMLTRDKYTRKFEGTTKLIQEEFQRLGFQIVEHSNLTATQMMKKARRMAALDHSQHNCFACVVRSLNDDSDAVLCSDGAAVGVQDLMDVFNASHCSSLAGKPKVFYMVMSRGNTKQGGVAVPGENGQELHPDGADFLLIHNTLPECLGLSNASTGVPTHLRILSGVLQRHDHTQDIMSCLAMANSQSASLKYKRGTHYCTAPVTSTLRKALIFR